MISLSEELLKRVSELRGFVLQGITYSVKSKDQFRIAFRHWNGSILTGHLRSVLQVNISSSEADVEKGDSVVLAAAIKRLEDGGKEVLGDLGHFFCDQNDGGVNSYPDINLSLEVTMRRRIK